MKKIKIKVEMNLVNVSLISLLAGLLIIYVNLTYLVKTPQLFALMNLLTAVIILGLPLIFRYTLYSKAKKIESVFPRFLKDVTGNVNAGMTLPQAIRSTLTNDYEALNPYVRELSAKISWGISLERALTDFSAKVKSKIIKRTVQTINEAHKSGGTMNTVLEAVAETSQEIEKIKKERSASIYAQMINGYLIYVIFLGVMIGMSAFLIPAFEFGEGAEELKGVMPELFRNLVLIQGLFAGLSVGKMAEGTLTAGVKHALALTLLGYSVFLILG